MKITDAQLIETTDGLIRSERALLLTALTHFREIQRRRLYTAYGYESLFKMMIARYGYSERQAYSRINAIKILKELPTVRAKIERGELNLTNLSLVSNLFKKEFFSREQKLEVLDKVSNVSTRDAIKVIYQFSSCPEFLKPDRTTQLTDKHIEVRFTANNSLHEKIAQLRGLLAHTDPAISLGDLFEKACDLAIDRLTTAPKKSRVKRELFQRSRDRCEICGSNYALEVDHIRPKAKGGDDSFENLRILCKACNQRAAINEFGQKKMDSYLS